MPETDGLHRYFVVDRQLGIPRSARAVPLCIAKLFSSTEKRVADMRWESRIARAMFVDGAYLRGAFLFAWP